MRELLARLGNPEREYPSIHVVGTKGKSTATRTIAALLEAEGLRTGSTTSPHASTWSERIQVGGVDADFEAALARVRPDAEAVGATQFETITAAALAEFAAAGVDAAVVEAGLGGRLDATNVLAAPVVLLTNVALEHTDVLGETREAIAREKLAVVSPGAVVVLGEPEWEGLAREVGAARVVVADDVARAAASAFLGRRALAEVDARPPGRLERRGREVWDGAHTLEAVDWLLARLDEPEYVLCVSLLRDKDVDAVLRRLATVCCKAVATASSNPRAVPAAELAAAARPHFGVVEAVDSPAEALARARELASDERPVLVAGSLYLLADLRSREEEAAPWRTSAGG